VSGGCSNVLSSIVSCQREVRDTAMRSKSFMCGCNAGRAKGAF
jgi:hypothetical protein